MKAEKQHLYPKLTLSLKLTLILIFCSNPYPITRTNHLWPNGELQSIIYIIFAG
jgi:hypothetical protein